ERDHERTRFALGDELKADLAAVLSKLHEVLIEGRGEGFQLWKAGGQSDASVLAPQGHEGARQLLADGKIVFVLGGQRGDLLEAIGVPFGIVALQKAPERSCLQGWLECVGWPRQTFEGRGLEVLGPCGELASRHIR